MDTDLSVAPKEYEQKIVAVDITVLDNKVPHPASAPVSAASAKKISKKKKTLKIVASASSASVPVVRPQVVRAWPVGIGEQSKYSLRWGVIEGGVATIRVNPPQDIEGVPALHYSGIVKSSKMMDFFYKIDNTIDTWVRLSDLAPLRQEIKQNESARFGRRVMMINPEKNEVKFYEILTKTTGGTNEDKRTDIMLNGSQDLFGALYFYRFVQNI
ncbi:MAG: DUF3108 domain-containing protein, partial [Bdellovibrionota bacterium]